LHAQLLEQANEVQGALTNAEAERLAKQYGIKGLPLLSCLPSLQFPTLFLYDFMHLIWENLMKNLVLHWTGEFKGLDAGLEDYTFSKAIWEASEEQQQHLELPSPVYLAVVYPILQHTEPVYRRNVVFLDLISWPRFASSSFQRPKYYTHFIRLVRFLISAYSLKSLMRKLRRFAWDLWSGLRNTKSERHLTTSVRY